MELRQYLSLIGKWLWLVVLSVAIAATASYLASRAATPIYRTKTTLMVGRIIQNPDPTSMDLYTGQQLAYTYAQLARREPVLQGAIESLALNMPASALAGQVSTNIVLQTQLLEIYVVDTNPHRAKALADAIAQQLILISPGSAPSLDAAKQAFLSQQVSDLESKIEDARDEISKLQQDLDAAISARQIQDLRSQITVLQGKITDWQRTYASLLTSLQGGNVNALSVVEEAALPAYPIGSNVMTNVMLASLIGLILAVGGAFLIEYLDDTIKTDTDVTSVLGLPTLGGIIDFGKKEGPSIATDNPKSISVEAYRALRTNIRFSSPDRQPKTLLITSPEASEGKTTTTANLGAVFARAGTPTIIVDADLRKPRQHRLFQLDNRTGLTTALVADDLAQMNGNLKESGVPNLRLLASGPRPPNPSELLSSERMGVLMQRLADQADVVIFDTPPALAVSDAAALANKVDGILLVVEAGKTRREAAVRAKEALEQVGGKILGVVLTKIPAKRRGYGHYYYYYYPSYYSDEDKKK